MYIIHISKNILFFRAVKTKTFTASLLSKIRKGCCC